MSASYDDYLNQQIRQYNDADVPLWDYTYQNARAHHVGLDYAETKEEAEENLKDLIDELYDTLEYIEGMKETDLA